MKRLIPLLFIALLVSPLTVFAQSTGGFGLRPKDPTQAYFRLTARPGEVVQDTLVAINDSDADVMINVIVSRASTALTGGLAFDGTAPKEGEPGTWLSINYVPGEVVVPAHNGLELPFSLTIPKDAQPGDYAFGFVASLANEPETTPAGGGFQVRVVSQSAVSVLITIPGGGEPEAQVRDVSLTDDASGISRVIITLANPGAVGWQGQGALTLKAVDGGGVVFQREFNVGYVLPGDSLPYPVPLVAPLSAGEYVAEVTLGDGHSAFIKSLTISEPTATPDTSQTDQPLTEAWNWLSATSEPVVPQATSQVDSPNALPVVLFAIGVLAVVAVALLALLTRGHTVTKTNVSSNSSRKDHRL